MTTPSPALEEVQRELRERIYRFVMQVRFVIAPVPLLLGCVVLFCDDTLWRRLALGGALGTACVAVVLESYLTKGRAPENTRQLLFVVAVLQVAVMLATGGVQSPVVMAMLIVTFVSSTLLHRRMSALLVAFQVASVWGAAGLELSGWLGPLLPRPFRAEGQTLTLAFTLTLGLVETMVLLVTRELGWRIQRAIGDLLLRATGARDESLRLHQEQLAEMTRLSSEIAHELKNPLASVKGLAALLARRVSGTAEEPLGVLRHEVDRMQRVLEDFLNFSRPLVPLSVEVADLADIARDVVALHAGLLEGQRLEVAVAAEPAPVVCDPRKVRQVLVNLLQNAIDASPVGATIDLVVRREVAGGTVTVRDAGVGLDPTVAARVFEAGVTTKERGSGIGLSVARSVARQHGGDVVLESSPGAGCSATLRLPATPPLPAPLASEVALAAGEGAP